MELIPSIQWFPGHMTKTKRMIEKNLSLVDLVLELTDARIPSSSKNPELDRWVDNKPRVVILNKADLADKHITNQWISYYKSIGVVALAMDCKTGLGVKSFIPTIRTVLKDSIQRWEDKGMVGRPIRIMIVGIPNVGKSSFINRMSGSRRAKVEDRPGVTRGKQWITLESGIELLDTPGVLWPKFSDPIVGERLAFTGAVKDGVVDQELLAIRLLIHLYDMYPDRVMERYKFTKEEAEGLDGYDFLKLVGKKRGMLVSGGEVNTERIAITLIDEYRAGKLGRISFETPENQR